MVPEAPLEKLEGMSMSLSTIKVLQLKCIQFQEIYFRLVSIRTYFKKTAQIVSAQRPNFAF